MKTQTFLAVITTTDLTFENTFYELFDDMMSFSEFISNRIAINACCEFVKLDYYDESVVRKFCILADSLEDAREHCENILLRMFLMNELS